MITPVILCGGSGTRLWPLSRSHMPKQLLAVHDEATMLQATAQRLANFDASASAPIVVCNDSHRFVTRRQLMDIGEGHAQLIAEPSGRNTAPALTLAALRARAVHAGDDPALLVMPADHVIADLAAFQRVVGIALRAVGVAPDAGGVAGGARARSVAGRDAIVTFGIVPTEPATGYGYLKVGGTSGFDPAAFVLERFVEKPDFDRARQYVASGEYLWNSGLFVMRASVWLRAMATLEPNMLAACEAALAGANAVGNDVLPDAAAFAACPANSIDYAVMEKLAATPSLGIDGVVVPLDAGWSDIGAWDSAWAIAAKDEHGNAAIGEAIFEASHNTYVRTTGPNAPVIACVGIDDAVVVHTPDAILVASKDHAQDVKKVAAVLTERSDSRAQLHRRVERPWGWYDSLGSALPDGDSLAYQVKHLGVYPGQAISLQLHHHRAEHWVIIRGVATITLGERVQQFKAGEHVHIPLGTVHRLANEGDTPVELIEVQLGSYLGEDDIVRLEDRYQRA